MFLSSVKSLKEVELVNLDFLSRNLASSGVTLIKQKNKEIENGINITSFTLEKKNTRMNVFILHLDKQKFICTGYHSGKIVAEKECKYESEIPSLVMSIFNEVKHSQQEEPIRFDVKLEMMSKVCEDIQKTEKNINSFMQNVKTTSEYESLKRSEQRGYEKVIMDSSKLLADREIIEADNASLIDPLLRIEGCKQSLQTVIMAYEEESAYLANVKDRIKENRENLQTCPVELSSDNLSQASLTQYVTYLAKLKENELKQKYLIS